MTENKQLHAQRDADSGRRGRKRRARTWIMALTLLGLGAAGGALTTVAVDANAHGGGHHGFRMHGHRHAANAAEAAERVQHVAAWALGSVDATDEQRERVDAILAGAVNDLFPMRAEHREHRRDLIAELARPRLDRDGLEQVRADFVANVSHEMRTPLTAIQGYAETLLHNPPSDPRMARQFLNVVTRHSERLGRLIDDLLALSDLEMGNVNVRMQPVATRPLLERVLELFRDQADKKHIHIRADAGTGTPDILGDEDRLQQLLINLIDNAVKYTPEHGEVLVHAGFEPESNGGDPPRVAVTVSDTGCGIPEKDLPRLTERFYRVDKARSRELGGTGLGLAIVKHITQAHGGDLKIESQLGKGTRVSIYLQCASGAEPLPIQDPPAKSEVA